MLIVPGATAEFYPAFARLRVAAHRRAGRGHLGGSAQALVAVAWCTAGDRDVAGGDERR